MIIKIENATQKNIDIVSEVTKISINTGIEIKELMDILELVGEYANAGMTSNDILNMLRTGLVSAKRKNAESKYKYNSPYDDLVDRFMALDCLCREKILIKLGVNSNNHAMAASDIIISKDVNKIRKLNYLVNKAGCNLVV